MDAIDKALSIMFERSWKTAKVPRSVGKPVSLQSSKGQKGGPRKPQDSQAHLNPWERGGTAARSGCH